LQERYKPSEKKDISPTSIFEKEHKGVLMRAYTKLTSKNGFDGYIERKDEDTAN